MSVPPRIAEVGSYEYDVGMKWKELEKLEAEKKQALEVIHILFSFSQLHLEKYVSKK